MIILIASVSVMASYFIGKMVLGDVQKESVKVKTAERISSDVVKPDPAIFNSGAINPTVEVIIGDNQADASR